MSDKVVVHLKDLPPLVLRVDEMVDGEIGKIAKQIGEIPLQSGRNEVDAGLWAKWKALHEGDPLLTGRHITEEKQDAERDSQEQASDPAADGGGPKDT